MMKGKIAVLWIPAALSLLLAGCSALDVVGRTAVTTFGTVLERRQGGVSAQPAGGRWVLEAPGGETFEWSTDFASPGPDFRLTFAAAPFLEAGLDPARLPAERYVYDPAAGLLSLEFEAGQERFSSPASATALDTFKQIVARHRPLIGYHEALDHYGIGLGDGNMFEWAKDLATNDKDLVFVLNPQPWLQAGVDPARVEGWVFAKVPLKDSAGRSVEVDKLLKPYDLP